jgi:hypothetical protein
MVDWNNMEVEVHNKMVQDSPWQQFSKNQNTEIKLDLNFQPTSTKEGYEWRTVTGKKFTAGLTLSSLLIRVAKKSDGTCRIFHTDVKNSWKVFIKVAENWIDVKSVQ